MDAQRRLERHALAAHRAGDTWNQFWERHGAAIIKAEPHSRAKFRRLVAKLLHLVASGDPSGQEPAGEPWLLDDVPEPVGPHDTRTEAKCQLSFPPWPMPSTVEVTTPFPR
jgi:hypothetical protein